MTTRPPSGPLAPPPELPSGYSGRRRSAGECERTRRQWERRCHAATFEPLRVTCRLSAPVALGVDGCIHLDAILSMVAANNEHYPHAHRPYAPMGNDPMDFVWVPCRWDDRHWACSALWPSTPGTHGAVQWSQRPTIEYMHLTSAKRVNLVGGPTRARRERLALSATTELTAILVGNADLVRKLLRYVPSIGTKRSQGLGRVSDWDIQPVDTDEYRQWDGIWRRPIPRDAGGTIGIVPPYWYRPWWTPGTRAGAPVEGEMPAGYIDWFDAVDGIA